MNSQSKNNNNAVKPFCKVCFDAGKTDTDHFVRKTPDPKSPVVCPTLLALQCRYCDQAGHTVKYCAVLKKNNKDKARADSQLRRVHVEPPVVPSKPKNNNLFALLEEDNDSDSDDDNTHDDNFETHDDNNDTQHAAKTWAQIAATLHNANILHTGNILPAGVYSANLLIADDEW
jgi:hypothetical protein